MGTKWNYVKTLQKPTVVTHSCAGNFTGREHLNFIIAKHRILEIFRVTEQGLQIMGDFPIHGRIIMLELFRPPGSHQDIIFILTNKFKEFKFSVLKWDSNRSTLLTSWIGDVSEPHDNPLSDKYQIGIIDRDCRLIGLRLYKKALLKVIPFDENGHLMLLHKAINVSLETTEGLDNCAINFLYGCTQPTIVVLYQDDDELVSLFKTYEVFIKRKKIGEGHMSWRRGIADLDDYFTLIPVPPPLCGVMLLGRNKMIYSNASNVVKTFRKGWAGRAASMLTAYGRINQMADNFSYLLGDDDGGLHQFLITHLEGKVTDIDIKFLGETSIASTISYLSEAYVYVGSSGGDSQLIKLNLDASNFNVLENYINLGPIRDLCVVDRGKRGQIQVVTCSGTGKNGSIRMIPNCLEITTQALVEAPGIKGMWPLRSSTDDAFDTTILVVSFVRNTIVFEMDHENRLIAKGIDGVLTQGETLFCHNAVGNRIFQVTTKSVRLICSASWTLQNQWEATEAIIVATTNATQVLLCTQNGSLIYLEIENGILVGKSKKEKLDISCLDINPIGEDQNYSQLAAVGTWHEKRVRIFSLPLLDLVEEVDLGGRVARSVLLCAFEGISYLLCALGDGHLLKFLLNLKTGKVVDRKEVSLGTQPITLREYSTQSAALVFGAPDKLTVIYSSNKKLLYRNVNLQGVIYACPLTNSAAFPKSLAIARTGDFSIATIDDIHIRSIPLGEQPLFICHDDKSRTFAICSCSVDENFEQTEERIHLLNDQSFDLISTYKLYKYEFCVTLLSCSFTDDDNMYYCVGTRGTLKNRILVFRVEDDGKLELKHEKICNKTVHFLNAFKGKLLAAVGKKLELYEWTLQTLHLKSSCSQSNAQYVSSLGNVIAVAAFDKLALFEYKEGVLKKVKSMALNRAYIKCFEILKEDIYLCCTDRKQLFTALNDEDIIFDVAGDYHIGEKVNSLCRGSLAGQSEIPGASVIFGTETGSVGVVASFPREVYIRMMDLQSGTRKVLGVCLGGLTHVEWRSNRFKQVKGCERETFKAKRFVDGDLLEVLFDLSEEQRNEVLQKMRNGTFEDGVCRWLEDWQTKVVPTSRINTV